MGKTRSIELSRGYTAIVDAEDYERLSRFKWKSLISAGLVYAANTNQGLMHRVVMGAGPNELIDHWDRDTLNNRKSNLRRCTRVTNGHNSVKTRGTSKYRGVSYHTRRRKWLAQIVVNRKHYFLGRFDTEAAAKTAYDNKKKELVGDFYPL